MSLISYGKIVVKKWIKFLVQVLEWNDGMNEHYKHFLQHPNLELNFIPFSSIPFHPSKRNRSVQTVSKHYVTNYVAVKAVQG